MSVRSIEAEVSIKSGVQAECTIGREVIVEVHEEVNLETLTATENGQYRPAQGVDGWDRVTVSVPERQPVTEPLSVTANGQYAPAQGVDGFSDVTVNIPERIPVTESLTVTENGTYEPTEGIDGYNTVVVAVPPTIPDISPLTVTDDGTYTASGDGYNPVTVNTGVASLRQEIASAETASGCSPLIDGLTALTTYANEVTGAQDETLSDAVESLVRGFGGGSGQYQTYTVTVEVGANSVTKADALYNYFLPNFQDALVLISIDLQELIYTADNQFISYRNDGLDSYTAYRHRRGSAANKFNWKASNYDVCIVEGTHYTITYIK